jgi:hypothetical protein
MTTTTSLGTTAPTRTKKRSIVLAALVAAAVTSLVNLGIASASLAAGTPATPQLSAAAYLTFSVLAGVVGAIGWAIVRRRAANPRRLLGMLALAVLIASFVPLAILAPGIGWAATVTLASMHTATVGLAVASYALLMPVRKQ